MRLSNKSTFSLACLILLMAFVALPVMAHTITDNDDHPTDHPAHPVVRSMTLKGDAADGYVGGDSFLIDIIFESANETNKITAPDHENTMVTLDAMGFDVLEILQKSPTFFEARLRAESADPNAVASAVHISVSNVGYTPPDPLTDNVADPTKNPAKVTVTFDNAPPLLVPAGAGGPEVRPLGDDLIPLDAKWANPFRFVFTLTGYAADMSLDLSTLKFTAEPNEVTFGAAGRLLGDQFAVTVTPKPNTGTSTKAEVEVAITITIKDKADNTATAMHTVTLAARAGRMLPPTGGEEEEEEEEEEEKADIPETGDPIDITVPAKSYVLVSKSGASMGLPETLPDNASQVTWGHIPDLEDLLYRGGTLLLTHVKATKVDHDNAAATAPRQAAHRDLVITEIMWALNTAEIGKKGEIARQWIEIYNNLEVDVTATISGKYSRPASSATSDQVMLDRVSNVVSAGWRLEGLGQNGFNDGQPTTADTDFISMYRKERGKDGWIKGHWSQSSEVYLAGHLGTPGTGERGAVGTIGATGFTVGNVIFNEIANRDDANKAYEWIELRNKSGGEQNLKNWQISMVTAVGTDNAFYTFPNSDRKIPAGDVLLLVDTNPATDPSHPLATGWDITRNANSQVNGAGAHSPRYMVANFAGNGLPDNGNFVLILRNHNNKRNKAEHLIDIAGYASNLAVSANEAGYTNLWPLKGGVRGATLGNNKLEVNQVHRRQRDHIWGTSSTRYDRNNGNHHDDTAWRGVGWTSVGYKRNTARNNAHGGTPGYQNNAAKSEGGDAIASVVISEIMSDTSRNLPQWIEIQNLSNTYGINLNNWSLFIVNHHLKADGEDYTEGKLSEPIDIDGELPPNQTMLVVSTAARSYTNLPNERVFNLRRGRGEKLLNPNGFQITLKAKTNERDARKHQTVDTVGNLGNAPAGSRRADAQSFEDTPWDWPAGIDANGNRVSVARKTSSKVTADGTTPGAWVSSMDDSRLSQLREFTYYGHPNDVSSPGQTVGTPLPVSLSYFRPTLENGEVVIRWTTESELDNAGFNILRSDSQSGEFKQVNSELVQGAGTTGERNTYKWVDESAKLGVVYYYQIEDVSFAGERQTLTTTKLKGLISANNKLTTLWGGLKSQQD